ncbi:MAG TPA: T9SS type A sorting domain-containing protein [Puia sp.]|nr:T9SS type A sorting domain-containing protein [Puia sp.]
MKPYSLIAIVFIFNLPGLHAQNLVTNSAFTGGSSSGWSTGSSIEINPQTTYGGPSSSIYVTEIDVERSINQQVCILPGLKYTFTYSATRRPQSGTPATPGMVVKVTGTSSNTNYLNSTQSYTNNSWLELDKSFTITIPSNSTDKKVNIQFSSSNNTTTYGVIVWDIELAPASTNPISINGPTTSGVSTPNNFSLNNAPAGTSYNWSFSADANHASSTNAAPTGISWASLGVKNVSVALSNGTCTMATYSRAVTISTTLAVDWTSFTGTMEGEDAHLTWISEHETNGKYFRVTRSTDGVHFDSIGVVASGNASAASTYRYIDKAMPMGTVYYRICHVDLDNAVSFSKIITLNNENAATGRSDIRLFPNPAVAVLNYDINSPQAGRVYIQIFSPSGVLMSTSQAQLSSGANHNTINISGLNNGNYFLKIVDAQGSLLHTQTFAKI